MQKEKMPPPDVAGAEGTPASDEEQAMYDRFVHAADQVAFDPERLAATREALMGSGDPVEGLANTAASIVKVVMDLAAQQGSPVPPDVAFAAGQEVFEMLAAYGDAVGISEFGMEGDGPASPELEHAFLRGLDMVRMQMQAEGQIDQQAAAADLQQFAQAEAAGQLPPAMQAAIEQASAAGGAAPIPEAPPDQGGMVPPQKRRSV